MACSLWAYELLGFVQLGPTEDGEGAFEYRACGGDL